ncbi:GNAT family N-acetyltransferase [Pseudomonas sp. RIT-PI-S]|uniref:GNAT family N-acetyltransferase n=1 Tax=Pseudomonas sp. RIT-PI-S TaxID=3035295 RepID=UPI0021DA3023|nr:GNAT family N-acetyltransferase [Pseudomonas sp. RIT-PI-S]
MNDLRIRLADWHRDYKQIHRIRESVFVAEQAVAPEQEWDSEDETAIHFLAEESGFAIGTARLLPDGYVGRLSVLKDWRGLKVGDALMQAVIAEASQRGIGELKLTAQLYATAFYQRFGFEVVSEEFLEAGLPHVDMVRRLA